MQEAKTIAEYSAEWHNNSELNPLYVILTEVSKTDGRWDEVEFFKTGQIEIDNVFQYMKTQRIVPSRRTGRFLDFGCGVGRRSRALISRFDSGIGIDISPLMIELASKYNTNNALTFRVNSEPWLASIPDSSIDFVYSNIVLQHMPLHLQRAFLTDFMRVLAPGGIAAFQIPTSEFKTLVSRLKGTLPAALIQALKRALGRSSSINPGLVIKMHVLPESAIVAIVRANHGMVIACPFTNMTETQHEAEVLFMKRVEALERARMSKVQHYYLSQFFFVKKVR